MSPAKKIFDDLKSSGILSANGIITFDFMNTKTAVRDRSVVGNVIQSWLETWLTSQSIPFAKNPNTQNSPDFYLNPTDKKRNLLEVKCFYRSANFDIGNFLGYCSELEQGPHKLNADYLIFSYSMADNGVVSVKDIWLKKVWEICGPSSSHKIKVQAKKGEIVNIRPISWYSASPTHAAFNSPLPFLRALNDTLRISSGNHLYAGGWLKKVQSGYEAFSGEKLV